MLRSDYRSDADNGAVLYKDKTNTELAGGSNKNRLILILISFFVSLLLECFITSPYIQSCHSIQNEKIYVHG